ncbi:hypothetical protein COW46_03540 [Candidatus Gracilibacteria bacterium CG17_big_fil_post_rev_8_21_14_2_50_48_13]|nr:MAG: hypothetical protein COW46_03540 [Candidatus Gracilibacteria bacterium CG17_big_fil_post_rev_8_21_14_2_50_48_13]
MENNREKLDGLPTAPQKTPTFFGRLRDTLSSLMEQITSEPEAKASAMPALATPPSLQEDLGRSAEEDALRLHAQTSIPEQSVTKKSPNLLLKDIEQEALLDGLKSNKISDADALEISASHGEGGVVGGRSIAYEAAKEVPLLHTEGEATEDVEKVVPFQRRVA